LFYNKREKRIGHPGLVQFAIHAVASSRGAHRKNIGYAQKKEDRVFITFLTGVSQGGGKRENEL